MGVIFFMFAENHIITISIIAGIIIFMLLVGSPYKPLKLLGNGIIRIMIGALLLFFLNTFGTVIGIHIPINFATAAVSGFLGIPGLAALVAIDYFIM